MQKLTILFVLVTLFSLSHCENVFSRELSCAAGTIKCIGVKSMEASIIVEKLNANSFEFKLYYGCQPFGDLHPLDYGEPCTPTVNKFRQEKLKKVTKDAVQHMENSTGKKCSIKNSSAIGSTAGGTFTDSYSCQ